MTKVADRSQTSGLSVYVYMVDYIKCYTAINCLVSTNRFCKVPLRITRFDPLFKTVLKKRFLVVFTVNHSDYLPIKQILPANFHWVNFKYKIELNKTKLLEWELKLHPHFNKPAVLFHLNYMVPISLATMDSAPY